MNLTEQMLKAKSDKEEKQSELEKYLELVLATLDYYLDNKEMHIKSADFDSFEYFKGLKIQTEEHYHRSRLSKLKRLFRTKFDPIPSNLSGLLKPVQFSGYNIRVENCWKQQPLESKDWQNAAL
ncbi:hypothetical protein LXM25_04400 [Dyadobacter sp. LJ53]|uniref:hypothetical protein n=1 Tax=Dyadobacter chenwenxiniae TaxID=2906456 RepID=UPI001F187C66|nr:hypothetical protein [Dyadobacter chenwenxiniae]MCF0049286.1 hypothetical protein [Dyadobacter chenwenxiniae]